MSSLLRAVSFILAVLYAAMAYDDPQVFDVTNFGATTEGQDNSQAFLAAWTEACQFEGNAAMVIPQGTFVLGPVEFEGPCRTRISPAVEIQGTLKALPDPEHFPDHYWIMFSDLHNLSLSGGGTLDGQGQSSWEQNDCHGQSSCNLPATSLMFDSVKYSAVHDLTLVNSKAFHVNFYRSRHIDAYRLTITAPGDSPNTDGIHIGDTRDINILDSQIGTGDDCISIGPGSRNVFVYNITCGPGHGISVGSLGKYQDEEDVEGVIVLDCTMNNTTNGLRIKTWPGSPASQASNITFQKISMTEVANPIIIDQQYCPVNDCTDEPSKVAISDVIYDNITGTSSTKVAVGLLCSELVPCTGVKLNDINLACAEDNCLTTSSCSNVQGRATGSQIPPPCL